MTREYVIECEHVTEGVWSPVHMFVDESVARPLVRCEGCRHHGTAGDGRMTCDVREAFRTITEPRGYCWRGEEAGA